MKMKIENHTPDNRLEGFGDGNRDLHTPEVMRDCIRTRYWENPARVELCKAAARLADDFKRRGFKQQNTLGIIQEHLTAKLNLAKPEQIKQINNAVAWVYKTQEHPITCSGALNRDGLCHKLNKGCRFYELAEEIRKFVISSNPIIPPADVEKYLEGLHPTDALFARWTYQELIYLEQEKGLLPGNPAQPILIGFRKLADRVKMRNKQASAYTKDTAVNSIHLLTENEFVRKSVQGYSGNRRGRALSNGYVRVLARPPSAIIPISPIYNPESRIPTHI